MSSVDKPLRTPDQILSGRLTPVEANLPDEVEIDIEGMESLDEALANDTEVTMLPDGGAEIGPAGGTPVEGGGHFDNLADQLGEEALSSILNEALDAYTDDVNSRADWEKMAARGLTLLGMRIEDRNDPWENACGVYHPMLLEAVVRFWAKACKDLAPANGPAKIKILGEQTPDIIRRGARVKEELNHIITDQIPAYRSEQSRMVFNTGLLGSGFKKVWYDTAAGVIQDRFVHPQDLIAPYNTTDLATCPRFCHRTKMFPTQILQQMNAGVYRKVALQEVTTTTRTDIDEKQDDIQGQRPGNKGGQHTILEYYMDLELAGLPESEEGRTFPYCITIDKDEEQILSVRRHWHEDDPKTKRITYFVGYQYIPGFSIYSVGLVHLIGSLAEGATQILRQLVDAGTLSNLPAGFKTKGFRVKGDDRPLRPGEFRDVDIPGAKIADSIMPLPFKEPSAVLAGLLENLVTEGRRVGSVADVSAADIGNETPVGTTLALLEESLVIQSSIQTNLLDSLGRELEIIFGLVRDHLPPEYEYAVGDGATRADDFADPLRVIPVADPNASSKAMKVVAYQEVINLSATAPEIYNRPKLHRGMLEALEIPDADQIVPLDEDMKPLDPITENMNIIRGKPVKVFDYQDHQSHLAAHMSAIMDPKLQEMIGQSPQAQAIQAAAMAHIQEHVAYEYRSRVEQIYGQALPDPETPLPPEIERQAAPALAEAAKMLLQQNQQQAAQEQAQQVVQDPVFQLQQRELDIKEMDQVRKAETDEAKIELEREKLEAKTRTDILAILASLDEGDLDRLKEVTQADKELRAHVALEIMKVHAQKEISKNKADEAKAKGPPKTK